MMNEPMDLPADGSIDAVPQATLRRLGILAEDIAGLLEARHREAFAVLGMHPFGGGLVIRTFQPGATAVGVLDAQTGAPITTLECVHNAGLFAGRLERIKNFPYRLRVAADGAPRIIEEPYRFPPVLTPFDLHLIGEGKHLELYERLGSHLVTVQGVAGTAFAVWAPNARSVSVIGDFNNWDGRRHPMRNRGPSGVWEIFLPGVGAGARYKHEIKGPQGELLPLKADPWAQQMELRPATASIVAAAMQRPPEGDWTERRKVANDRASPISIYEVHLGSWMRVPEQGNRFLTWAELGDRLVPYARDMGFTHLQLMPVSEFPFDGSWGYQPIGLFAPTARFGAPEGFAAFVARCHAEGLALLIDWVPGHFPTDEHGLARFDGTHLYEHADPRAGYHQDWNTLIYNYGRKEVANFLTANALYWLSVYGVDGLRVDAVASMLYLDYSRKSGEWIPNQFGGNENLEATAFIKRLNETVYGRRPGITMAAEESTAWSGVSRPTFTGGLGFGYKWNMGWMNDTLRYFSHDPVHRRFHHHDLTFGLIYAYSENFILPLSHDEVVHGKGSLLGRMPGDRWQRFANLRAYYGFMWAHPGKKLLFMGGEFAQDREWDYGNSLDWHLLESAPHRGVQALVRDLNALYRKTPALHALDCDPAGFQWIELNDADNSVLSFVRLGPEGTNPVLIACNFTPVVRGMYRLGVPRAGLWREVLNTDDTRYGGSGVVARGSAVADERYWHGRSHSLSITLPPLATVMLEWTPSA